MREFQFINPHPFLIINVSEAGKTVEWRLEMDNRYELINEGMSADTLKPGDRVVAIGSLSRTNQQNLYLMRLDRASDGFRYEQIGASPRVRRGRSYQLPTPTPQLPTTPNSRLPTAVAQIGSCWDVGSWE